MSTEKKTDTKLTPQDFIVFLEPDCTYQALKMSLGIRKERNTVIVCLLYPLILLSFHLKCGSTLWF